MEKYLLNGKRMKTRDSAYDHMAQTMNFPDYFGRNLDALYDVLTERSADVTLKNAEAMINSLGSYGCGILKCFFDAAEQNPDLAFKIK